LSTALENELYRLYAASIYPVLLQNDPEYRRSVSKAGIGPNPKAVPAERRASFEQEMKLQAFLGSSQIMEAHSLAPGTIRAGLLTGPLMLYRISQTGVTTPPGIWWFGENVAQRCRNEAGTDPQKRLDWLRQVLAVSYNWSSFNKIERLQLHSEETIPAVFGRGLPMGHYNVKPYIDRDTGQRMIDVPPDYWKRKDEILRGGELQTVLPWIPVLRIAVVPFL
jgi:hypothetical protein